MKDKSTASILAFFLGGIGAHHFYLNKTGRGILYIVFCWTFIPVVASFIEFIMLATMETNEFHMRYNFEYIDHSEQEGQKLDNLKKLHDLKVSGAISSSEYEQKKQKLVG